MTLKQLRNLIDRIDHKHDDKNVVVSTDQGDFDFDLRTEHVVAPSAVFLFASEK